MVTSLVAPVTARKRVRPTNADSWTWPRLSVNRNRVVRSGQVFSVFPGRRAGSVSGSLSSTANARSLRFPRVRW